MKIGLIGNMNNNNFALLRYLLDLGADADLILMSDDGVGPLAHFAPSDDTWNFSKWQPHIKSIEAPNRYISAIGGEYPWNVLFWAKHALRRTGALPRGILTRPPSLSRIRRFLQGYDRLVGSGVAPALMEQLGLKLDVFYPYASGVEWVRDPDVISVAKSGTWLKRRGTARVQAKQIAGIKKARHVISSDLGFTAAVFDEMGVKPRLMQSPVIYRESAPESLPAELSKLLQKLRGYDLRFVSHARHRWVNTGQFDDETWESKYSKHNNWIISAYAGFRRRHPQMRSVLVLTEYGTDVEHTKALCQELNIAGDILWIPKAPRMHLLEIISACDVGIGEFYQTPRMIWGGTALEIMACGKPLIQGFVFEQGEYQAMYGNPPPPLCPVQAKEDLEHWLTQLGENSDLRKQVGDASQKWFNSYNGAGLARQWLSLIQN